MEDWLLGQLGANAMGALRQEQELAPIRDQNMEEDCAFKQEKNNENASDKTDSCFLLMWYSKNIYS